MLRNSHPKLKYVLPLAQIALALALLVWDRQWTRQMRLSDMPGPSPASTLLTAINFPVAILQMLYSQYLFNWRWDPVIFFLSVGLLWYWVSLNILSWRESRTVYTFSSPPLRITGDAIVSGLSLFFIFKLCQEISVAYVRWWRPLQWASRLIDLAWCVTLVFFFGRDLLQHFRRSRGTSESDCQP
jgi:hypothetical protein